MAFEEFEKSKAVIGDPMVTITRYGQLNLNNACYKKFFKDSPYVKLYYDAARKVVGIKPVKEKTANSFKIRMDKLGKSPTISAIAFLKHYAIRFDTTQTYEAGWSSKENLVEVSIA